MRGSSANGPLRFGGNSDSAGRQGGTSNLPATNSAGQGKCGAFFSGTEVAPSLSVRRQGASSNSKGAVVGSSTPPWQRYVFVWGGLVLVVASLAWARIVLIPVVLAILLAFILSPLVTLLQRRGLPRVPSAILVVTL